MVISQYIVGIVGVTVGQDKGDDTNTSAVSAMIAFICLNITFFATTWGPCAWIVIGEIFPLPIRSRGVALSTASNWFWNCVNSPDYIVINCSNKSSRSSPLSPHTWSMSNTPTSPPRSSSCGAPSASSPSYLPISSFPRRRDSPWSKSTRCSRKLLLASLAPGYPTLPSPLRWVLLRRDFTLVASMVIRLKRQRLRIPQSLLPRRLFRHLVFDVRNIDGASMLPDMAPGNHR